jgi:hypothetical protein
LTEIKHKTRNLKIRYKSGRNLNKKLFGYGPWAEKKKGKTYKHKHIPGILEGTPSVKCGRACIIIPEDKADQVKNAIMESGGEIEFINRVLTKGEEKIIQSAYLSNLGILIDLLDYVEKAKDVKNFETSINKSIKLTKKFNAYLKEYSQYSQEIPNTSPLEKLLNGLKTISKSDLEAAKIQTQFLRNDIEEERTSFSKDQ